jgi:hypothetical protein
MQKHAILLSKIFTNKEKKFFVDRMTQLISADGKVNKNEAELLSIFNPNNA